MANSPYKLFQTWLFDGNLKTPIPEPEVLLKYNSPITHKYLLSMFMKHAQLNHYLDQFINNYNFAIIEREEAFKFVKQCVHKFKVRRNMLHYSPYPERKGKLFLKLKNKIPYLKDDDISALCEIIDNSDDKDIIHSSLGIDNPKKQKIRVKKSKEKNKGKKISLKDYLEKNFKIMGAEGGAPMTEGV